MKEPIVPEPKQRIQVARNLLIFGLFVADIVLYDSFDTGLLKKVRTFENLNITPNWDDKDIVANTKNLSLCVLGNCFLVVDEALDEVFGKKPQKYADTDLDSLRIIIYMLRCAIAHGATAPRWKAQEQFKRIIRINDISYQLDARHIDGKLLEHKDFGRLDGALRLIDYSCSVIDRENEKTS
jgi:hypothetical protein